MKIRRARKQDFPKLIKLMTGFWKNVNKKTIPQYQKAFYRELKDKNVERFLLFDGEDLVGNLTIVKCWIAWARSYLLMLEEININRKYRNKGYGLRLLDYAISYAKKIKARELWVETGKENKTAQKLYEKRMKQDKNAIVYKIRY